MRFGIGTGHNHPVNFHLLISPEDPEHVEQTLRYMRRLKFEAHGDSFACDRDDLIRLGKAHLKDNAAPNHTALAVGTNQFKVDLAQLKEEWGKSDWAQANILIAVAAAEGDGTSGLQNDSSLATVRKEIEKFAAIIFASSSKQRDFWLGQGVATPQEIRTGWNGPKSLSSRTMQISSSMPNQIIVAKAAHHKKGGLPDISYVSGGLENSEIRKQVCENSRRWRSCLCGAGKTSPHKNLRISEDKALTSCGSWI